MNIRYLATSLAVRVGLLGLLAATASSCTSTRDVNYKSYVKMPSKPSSVVCRAVLKSVPYTKKRAFYGNYGGSGCVGGLPADEMDEYFRRHDAVYRIAKSKRTMLLADEELVKALRRIDPRILSEEGREYRDRAIKFMESSAARMIGKPLTAGLWKNEPPQSYFSDPETVRWFFQLSDPGIPSSTLGSAQRLSIERGAVVGWGEDF